ncbi:ADYC domain-containing protein [Corallococcus sp. bb12-1]|uniref:ADYC domain-containing protein n=1 Tax=Corallococcus sp. bb12-1 TaxID=2996784 RepID=UPI00226E3663|nr:ADYC domain-containing protein [Corallococcus sp. bb12-1]MCY1040103.1 ADYC domain-containing protein [Corallococcus sp. bb12-1]
MKPLRAWLGCLAWVMVMGGCILPASGRPPAEARPDGAPGGGGCPTGQCDPDPNGLGIYITEGHNYCFVHEKSAPLCPEGFVNTPEGVVMKVRSRAKPHTVLDIPVALSPRKQSEGRTLAGIHAAPTGFFVAVAEQGSERKVQGEDLEALRLTFTLPVDVVDGDTLNRAYEMGWQSLGGNRLRVLYRQVGTEPWLRQCAAPESADVASLLLPARRVDGLSAAVQGLDTATTLACETGAIGACLGWGYQPWDPTTLQDDPDRAVAYGACLQAKRAAYFVGLGDLQTYTVSGTDFLRRDAHGFGIRSSDRLDELEHVEALWSPRGAECLNPMNRRRDLPLPKGLQLPLCGGSPQWSATGTFATGVPRPLKF